MATIDCSKIPAQYALSLLPVGKGTLYKKVSNFPVPRRDVTHQSPWPGIIKLFPARVSLVSDIPAGTGKWLTFFFIVCAQL
jgi:hypothetical protein